MNWFKQNPFFGGLALLAGLAVAAALYFVFTASSQLALQQEEYTAKSSGLRKIQDAKPFPDADALELAEKESSRAAEVLQELEAAVASQIGPIDAALTPQGFQDKLNSANQSLQEKAATAGVSLPEDFYLGFDPYRAQPPPGPAAPLLGQQLDSINEVATILVGAGVKGITSITRPALAAEGSAKESGENEENPDLVLAPFDIEFVSEQSDFREALGAIISAKPLVVVKLLTVTNSQPTAPAKEVSESEATQGDRPEQGASQIPVLFGQETVTVKMRLAAVSGAPAAKDE